MYGEFFSAFLITSYRTKTKLHMFKLKKLQVKRFLNFFYVLNRKQRILNLYLVWI